MASWIIEGTLGSVLEHLKANASVQMDGGASAVEAGDVSSSGLLGNALRTFCLQAADPGSTRDFQSRAIASQQCQRQ